MATSSRSSLKVGVLKLVVLGAVLSWCCYGVVGEIDKVQFDNRIVPTEFTATELSLAPTEDNETTTEVPVESKKTSDWTPVIILAMFLFGAATVGIPNIVSYRMREQLRADMTPKKRNYTVSLTLVDPNEANGFTRL